MLLTCFARLQGLLVGNNDIVSVLGRSGVLLYVDGKRSPLTDEDLNNWLRTLTAEQIDRIDIISIPGAKYEAEGNASIIDIRLKKSNNSGAISTISGSYSKGRHARGFVNASGNLRTEKFNAFGSGGYFKGRNYNVVNFKSIQKEYL
ncbi:MAG: iron complex outermembrane receptor protein [Saprospiraceae bacterium]|jgi:iron complex outermembrane receptor protein